MLNRQQEVVLPHLDRLIGPQFGGDVPDRDLLERFLSQGDSAAFAELVRRHGPTVLGVCRRVLHNAHDADDAFQATFLVLVRKAAAIGRRERVGNWLYGVAYRTALEARTKSARRRAREQQVPAMSHAREPNAADELRELLDAELSRLADKYREPLILCELQGRSRKEVARQLHIPEGTLSSRLATARRQLAGRLRRRGLALPTGALAAALADGAASAEVPAALASATVRSAV